MDPIRIDVTVVDSTQVDPVEVELGEGALDISLGREELEVNELLHNSMVLLEVLLEVGVVEGVVLCRSFINVGVHGIEARGFVP